ncbi:GNAT family N-acetyltransferase [Kribbella sp. NPDC000426]|uniref:GNAT family N-acetyltransferase n=1 Tax=Kribbella sp. NPDC000426 TaxID=3154255 RepID=UPI003317448C
MPLLVDPALPEGTLRDATQPHLTAATGPPTHPSQDDGSSPGPLQSDGLVLRPWRRDDASAVLAAFTCPDIQRWHVRRLDTLEEATEWIDQWPQRWTSETAASWAVVDVGGGAIGGVEAAVGGGHGGDGLVVGQVGLRSISLAEGSASLSYWVTPAARGRSVAARSVEVLSAWAFGSIGFNRLGIQHSTVNTASCRVAERTGYGVEGTLRQAIKHADGWHDWHLHGRLRTDA